ncbi:TatD family hydrolase [Patescibacteria group bacterium]|nr:TatD family hydrolase [Patescibacteria group bacterium]MBU1256349.1 TatD family hydrolase [Patescibacteria group bacterium]MBU1457199.1 TatD family hydrolase [Patescibacteria group bacterium]
MIVDTHCHLTDKRFDGDIEGVLERAGAVGVEKIIAPSTSLGDAKQAVKIADKFKGVYCLVGVHPEHVDETVDIARLRDVVESSRKVVGVGEIGLDFHYDKEKKTKNKQIELFEKQLELAVELGLPVAIHAREAEEEMREVFEKLKERNLQGGVFHCWGGNRDFLEYVLDKGFYVSFCGNITYKNKRSLQTAEGYEQLFRKTGSEPSCARSMSLVDLLELVPLDRLLLETDSPYLSPEPLRGELNEPKNVKITAKFIASTLGLDVDTLINQTTKNSLCLFSLEN